MTDLFLGDIELLAGIAWRGYLEHGRGAVFVDYTRADKQPLSVSKGYKEYLAPVAYVPAGHVILIGIPETTKMMDEYDPEKEIVVAFRVCEDAVKFMRIATNVIVAYEKRELELGAKGVRCN